jgi:MFS family permease
MGVATAGVGLVPVGRDRDGRADLIILLRILQGLALGGEYGGAAIYVAEHAPKGKRGFYTSFIQASVVGGFILSLAVVLLSNSRCRMSGRAGAGVSRSCSRCCCSPPRCGCA